MPTPFDGERPSPQLLHNDPVTLNVVQLELDHCRRLRRCHVGRLNVPKISPAQEDHAPAAAHALGELGGCVLSGAAAGGPKIAAASPDSESIGTAGP